MGIYIKNIKKPWRCDECMFTNSLDECIFLKTDVDIDGLNIDCPIVEIADRKTENSSEKPNNCDTCRFKDRYGEESICSTCSRHYSDCYEPKDIYPCDTCRWDCDMDICGRCRNGNLYAPRKVEPKDEPQTELVNDSPILVKDLVDDEFNPYDEECMRCKHLKLQCEFVPSYCNYEPRDENHSGEATEMVEPKIRCPKCGSTDYIKDLEKDFGVKDNTLKYKCINCNTYIKDEPQTCDTCRHGNKSVWSKECAPCIRGYSNYEPWGEPQTERSE